MNLKLKIRKIEIETKFTIGNWKLEKLKIKSEIEIENESEIESEKIMMKLKWT